MWPQLGPVGSFGLFNATSFVVAILWLKGQRRELGLSENSFWAAIWCLLVGAILGAKGLFLALGWEHYTQGRLRLWSDFGTGFVFFGGLLGALAVGLVFSYWKGLNFKQGSDYFAVAVPLGHALGRLGCFAAGCCHGKPSALPWAVSFSHPLSLIPEPLRGISLHPVQLYEAAGLAAIAGLTYRALSSVRLGHLETGSAFRLYLALYGLLRLAMDLFRGDGRAERFLGLSHQQGLALGCLAAAFWLGRFWKSSSVHQPMV